MIRAVEKVRKRLLSAVRALEAAKVLATTSLLEFFPVPAKPEELKELYQKANKEIQDKVRTK